MKTNAILPLASVALLVHLGTGCGGPPCPVYPHTDAGRALELHRETRRHVRSLRAEARVDQRGKEGRIRGTVFMFVELPDRVRFDAMTQFGPAAILTSDGERFALTDLRENRYSYGPTCPSNIARLLGIPLSGAEVSRLLLGDTPRIDARRRTIRCEGGAYVVTLEGRDGRRQEIELAVREADRELPPDQQHLRLVRSQVHAPDGSTEWKVRFSEHRLVRDPMADGEGGEGYSVAMPYEIHFVHPRHGADVVVKLEELDLNVDPPADAFEQAARPGIPAEYVPCD
ncbi:MAG: hypothetical protein ACODAU_08805 [Myxococcota bacterium]